MGKRRSRAAPPAEAPAVAPPPQPDVVQRRAPDAEWEEASDARHAEAVAAAREWWARTLPKPPAATIADVISVAAGRG